jgi:anti-repressor protein
MLNFSDFDTGSFTIKAYANIHGVRLDRKQASKLGKCASALCRQRSVTPGRSRDETFGYVFNYPESILEEVFKGL